MRALPLFLTLCACGRIGFDVVSGNGALAIRYDHVFPVYIVGNAIPVLTPTVTGHADVFAISPPLPAGLQLDPLRGTIDGTPSAVQSDQPYTVTARNAAGEVSTTIRLRTAEGFVVNNNGDLDDAMPGDDRCETATGTGRCTLRAAITELDAETGTRNVVLILAQTITLTAGLPGFTRSMEWVGEDTTTTIIDGNGNAMPGYATADLSFALSYVTLRRSTEFDHAFQDGITLIADHVVVSNNSGFAGSHTNGRIVLTNSTFDSVTDGTVYGGGSEFSIDSCTFINNTNTVNSIVYALTGTNRITNTTFVNNSAMTGTLVINNSTTTVLHTTFVGNSSTTAFTGGAFTVYSGGTATFANSLFVNNTGPSDSCWIGGAFTSGGGNLLAAPDGNCPFNSSLDPVPADPRIGALADNGGPIPSIALGSGSPAIDAASSADCLPLDARGVMRPQGLACDIGAVEQQ